VSDLPQVPEIEKLRELVITQPPEYVANSREDLLGLAEMARKRRDVEYLTAAMRAARVVEWEMAHRWPAKNGTGPRADDRPALGAAVPNSQDAWKAVYAVGRAKLEDILTAELEDLWQRRFRDGAHVGHNSGVPEWYTPADIIDAARDVLGGIDLDPASSPLANATVKAERYYTIDDDGLSQPWWGRVWMNPPYTVRLIDQFIARLIDEHRAGNVTAALVLTNNSTDTGWWQSLARCSEGLCMLEGRVRFHSPEGERGTPLQGQTVAYLGAERSLFIERFDEFGVVL
jgi:DNA N-6-adenine-methyltransferase (Dam)